MINNCLYVKNKKIYDSNNNEVLLKGVGLGGWMLPEGYMWGNHKYYERPRRFEQRIIDLIGEENANNFWDAYYKTFISDKDFELIKEHGYNSIRLPINFRMVMEENEETDDVVFKEYGFELIDYVINICKKHELYVVLDLHGAPGGQTGANIDDSKYDKPELFIKEIYQTQTIKLWEELARRYKEESIVAMYDLLNEPLPKHNSELFGELVPLYKRIIKAIRKIDPYHMISIEGVNWSTDFSVLNERLDENMIIHFHKYWNAPSIETIQSFLNKREELNFPLYMGEGGENDLYWYSGAFKLYDQLDISWNFWTYKKIENTNSIISFKKPKDWMLLWEKDSHVEKDKAMSILNEFLDVIKFENCTVNHAVTNHLLRKDAFITPSGFYDYYGKNVSFLTSNKQSGTMRPKDNVQFVTKEGTPYIHHFSRLSESQIKEEKYPFVFMNVDDFYEYSFVTTKSNNMITITHDKANYDVLLNGVKLNGIVSDKHSIYKFRSNNAQNKLRVICNREGILKHIKLN